MMLTRRLRRCAVTAVACSLLTIITLGGCDTGESTGEQPGPFESVSGGESSDEFRVVLANALSDTLSGRADFGVVVEPQSGKYYLVIRLAAGFDFAGGIVFARGDTTLPRAGEYQLFPRPDSGAIGDHSFTLFYREGMQRNFEVESGTLVLDSVTDTLIVGRFDALLRGTFGGMERPNAGAEVHAVGRFRAENTLNGYVIGL